MKDMLRTRIMCLVKKGTYENEEDIFKSALDVNWSSLFEINKTIKVSTTAIKCPLKSVDFMTLRIKDAICDFFRKKFVYSDAEQAASHLHNPHNPSQIYIFDPFGIIAPSSFIGPLRS